MNDLNRELRALFEDQAAETGEPRSHLTVDELAAYHDGELAPEAEGRAREHLTWCPECTGLLLEIDLLAEPAEEGDWQRADQEAWHKLRESLPEAGEIPRVRPFRRPEPTLGAGFPRLAMALAATFLITTVGLSIWVAQLRWTVDALSRPQANVAILDLFPPDAQRGEGPAVEEVTIPRGSGFVTLVLNPLDAPSYPAYRVAILDAGGRELWSASGLERSPWNTFTVGFPSDVLPPGEYRLQLEGLEGGRRERIGTFPLSLATE